MANIKSYRLKTNSVGLPDTTNIQDPQLRLFLDRLNQTFTDLQITVKGLRDLSDAKSLTASLLKEPSFIDFIKKEAERISKTEAKKEIQKNEEVKRVQNKVLEYISVQPTSLDVKPDDNTKSLNVAYSPDDILNFQKGVTWSSSDESIAKIDEKGNITPVSIGECVVLATSNYNTNITAKCTVKVTNSYDIFVNAYTKWGSADSNIFTESKTPSENDPVWNTNSEITVTVGDNQSEAEAKAAAAAGVISVVERRDFIAETKYVYWRDVDRDIVDENSYIQLYGLQQATVVGSDIARFYGKQNEDQTEITQLYSKALNPNSYVSPDQHKEYDADELLVAESIEIIEDSDTPWNVHWVMGTYCPSGVDGDDIFDGDRRYIVPTGESVTLTGLYASSRMTDTWFEMTTYDGKFPCWLKKSHIDRTDPDPNPWASVKKPYIDADEKIVYEGDVRFSIVSRAWSHGWFKYENVWYDIGGSDNYFVFKFDKFFAWSTAPSGGDVKTVYTKSIDGNEYGLVHGKEFTVIGYIKQSGTGIYSITVNSKVYYTTATYGV